MSCTAGGIHRCKYLLVADLQKGSALVKMRIVIANVIVNVIVKCMDRFFGFEIGHIGVHSYCYLGYFDHYSYG